MASGRDWDFAKGPLSHVPLKPKAMVRLPALRVGPCTPGGERLRAMTPFGAVRAILCHAALIVVVLAFPAVAQERITDFASDIAIAANGTLTVRETIAVEAENIAINHGIFRDFPTTYTDRAGNRVRVLFDVDEVTRDGRPEPYTIETIDNGKRVRIGDADAIVRRGPHTYVIVYKTDRQIGFLAQYDELYWNVTGNAWAFAIDHASATIHLPEGASFVQSATYTGPQGARGLSVRSTVEGDTVRFATTEPLGQRQGLTVAIGFSKGAVAPPSDAEKTKDFLRDNAATGAALAGLAALAMFYFVAWARFGRDPARGVIVPLFAPPKNFSAAAVRFVHRMAYDRKCFAAALIAMAVKGYLKISEASGTYTLTRTGKTEEQSELASTETALARSLFNARDAIALKNSNHLAVSRAITALRTALKLEDEGVYFVTNSGVFYAGIAIMVATGLAAAALSDDPVLAAFILFWLAAWTAGTSHLLIQVYQTWQNAVMGPGSRILNFFGALLLTIFAVPFMAGIGFGFFALGLSVPLATLIAILAQGVLAGVFYRLLKAPTLAGGKVRDEIDGFKMFLDTAEKDRLEKLNPPHVTPEIFERFLPYAIALDAENGWSRKFAAQAAGTGEGLREPAYTPSWYSGSSFGRLGTTGFAASIGVAVAGATAAAATAPGTSSGSGGGGSSGGGGGGGGGGGW
jgi:uncharacterized membrane protein YgcG